MITVNERFVRSSVGIMNDDPITQDMLDPLLAWVKENAGKTAYKALKKAQGFKTYGSAYVCVAGGFRDLLEICEPVNGLQSLGPESKVYTVEEFEARNKEKLEILRYLINPTLIDPGIWSAAMTASNALDALKALGGSWKRSMERDGVTTVEQAVFSGFCRELSEFINMLEY